MTTVWTLGHTQQPFVELVALLRASAIVSVLDVRSRPQSRFAPVYNRARLADELAGVGLRYRWFEVLGQRPYPDDFYDDDGHTLYERVVRQEGFDEAVDEIVAEAAADRSVLFCREEDPGECHRYHLLGKLLAERGVDVRHIRKNGLVQNQAYVGEMLGEQQLPLWEERRRSVWRSPTPMRDPA
jgi:uncharacterized protein (DUF488 family)